VRRTLLSEKSSCPFETTRFNVTASTIGEMWPLRSNPLTYFDPSVALGNSPQQAFEFVAAIGNVARSAHVVPLPLRTLDDNIRREQTRLVNKQRHAAFATRLRSKDPHRLAPNMPGASLAQRSPRMKKLIFGCIAFTLLVSLGALAQYGQYSQAKTGAQEKQAQKSPKEAKTVTGCLQKGDEPGEFSIKGEDGKVWGLKSSSVKLEEHLGHKVSVTGSASEESKAEEKREKKEGEVEKASNKEEYGDIRVTSLKMISDSCK